MMARPAKLNGYSIKEVAKIELELNTRNKIVRKLNVLEKEYLVFRSKYSKQIMDEKKKLKSELELGLVIDDAPVVTKKETTVIDVERDKKVKEQELQQLKEDNERLLESNRKASKAIKEIEDKSINAKNEYERKIATFKSKITELENRNIELVNEKQEVIRKAENTPNLEIQALKNELAQKEKMLKEHQNTINKAAETNKIIRTELEKQEAQNIDLVAENGELKRKLNHKEELYQNAKNEVDRLDTTIKGNQNMIKELSMTIDEKNEYIAECEEMIKGYQTEIFNLTKGAVEVPGDVGQLTLELAFYKDHAHKYYNELKGAN